MGESKGAGGGGGGGHELLTKYEHTLPDAETCNNILVVQGIDLFLTISLGSLYAYKKPLCIPQIILKIKCSLSVGGPKHDHKS